ncbi:hypothetical protein Pcinc_015560 [Petrolisthes cinctipes]|uniref:Uncharacterized protein n=1 Tax=Petrolisthes cinctipes TaxID=88211 RepID=A0AAE1FVH5_PETCI|nr:hypothetical protein Pcinc_020105 [Petrolisthes cinctipes]KAK3879917.1 hypothetical protein Pcinc_015560 [Petrolisthes cinctipes]
MDWRSGDECIDGRPVGSASRGKSLPSGNGKYGDNFYLRIPCTTETPLCSQPGGRGKGVGESEVQPPNASLVSTVSPTTPSQPEPVHHQSTPKGSPTLARDTHSLTST